jgi:hypothetical protein
MLVPQGGLSEDQIEWIASGKKFFAPVKVLSRIFRGKFIHMLEDLIAREIIQSDFSSLKPQLYKKDWVVYSKKSFAGPAQILSYLGRYTHRVAISNSRIIAHQQGKVAFRWKDYRNGAHWKIMQLDALEFMRRYLLHVLPANFYKIRYYGILSLANRKQKLKQCLVLMKQQHIKTFLKTKGSGNQTNYPIQRTCPLCHIGILMFFALLFP